MKRGVPALLLVLAVLAGCSSSPVRQADNLKSAEVNAELGLRYMLQGKNDLALEKLNRALEQDPKSATAHHYLAELYRRLDEHEEADLHYRRSVDLDPQDSSARNNYGAFLCGRRRYAQAEKQFLAVLKNPVYPGRAQTLENLGLCMREAGEQEKAEEYFRKALQADPRLPQALFVMAELSLARGNALSARAYLQRYAEAAPHTPQSLWLGIRVERLLGDKDMAASYGMLLKNNFPDAEETGLYLKTDRR